MGTVLDNNSTLTNLATGVRSGLLSLRPVREVVLENWNFGVLHNAADRGPVGVTLGGQEILHEKRKWCAEHHKRDPDTERTSLFDFGPTRAKKKKKRKEEGGGGISNTPWPVS